MKKIIKLVLGLLVVSGLGLVYGNFSKVVDEMKEGRNYVYISFSYPGELVSSVLVKKTPKSECDKWRSDYFNAANEQCVGCTVLANECRDNIPDKYQKALNKENIGSAYIYKPYTYPEVTVFEGTLPDEAFSKLCAVAKESLSSTLCFE
jgi:hypothetical protein